MGYRFIFGLISCLLLEPPGHSTALPFPEGWPNSYIPLSVSDSLATYISIWDTLSSEENAEMFTYSMGLRALSVSRHKPKEQYALYKKLLLEQMYSLKATGVRVDVPKIILPLLIDSDPALLMHDHVERAKSIDQTVDEFMLLLPKTTDKKVIAKDGPAKKKLRELLKAQLKIMVNRHSVQHQMYIEKASLARPIQNLNPADEGAERYFRKLDNVLVNSKDESLRAAPPKATVLLARKWAKARRLDTFVINLLSSHSRRTYIYSQLEREHMTGHVHYIPAVNGFTLPLDTISLVLKNSSDTLLHQGAIGCALSHLSIYRDIVEEGLPFSLVLEDDAVLLRGAKEHVLAGVDTLYSEYGDDWDVLITDFGSDKAAMGIERFHQHSIPSSCYEAMQGTGKLVVEINGPCSHMNSVSYVVSYHGAAKLTEHLLPLSTAIDMKMQDLVKSGVLRAFALVPFATGQLYKTTRDGSDMIERFVTVKDGQPVFTFNDDAERNCLKQPCVLRIFLTTKGKPQD